MCGVVADAYSPFGFCCLLLGRLLCRFVHPLSASLYFGCLRLVVCCILRCCLSYMHSSVYRLHVVAFDKRW